MSRDSGPVRPLEQKCLGPGLWYIEGYMVRRVRWRPSPRWRIDGPNREFRFLELARDWIREQVQG